MRVLATAGHVDHGKSSLVRALTGTDPDRWEEEKRRGLTIDLGFAFTTLPSGADIGFVDVPGHVRFLKNMLAGAGAVEAAVLVVAASEGWMPQTEEHLRILELLGVEAGLTVLTMADAVGADTLELTQLEVMERLAGSFLDKTPLVACDSVSGRGLDAVVSTLDELVQSLPEPVDLGRPRLWIDRVFSAKGSGTVVTGTLAGGSLARGDDVAVVPSGARGRVRSVQSGHTEAGRAEPGARVALNLAGVDRERAERGSAVVVEGQWALTATVEARLVALVDIPARRRLRVKAYVGSGEHDAILRPLAAPFARLDLGVRLPLAPGDRVILRDPGPDVTIGAAEVLEVDPPPDGRRAAVRLVLPLGERLLAARPILPTSEIGARAGASPAGVDRLVEGLVSSGAARLLGDVLVAAGEVDRLTAAVAAAVAEFHERQPLEPGIDLAELAPRLGVPMGVARTLATEVPDLVVEGSRVRSTGHVATPTADPGAVAFLDALTASPFTPPTPAGTGTDPATVRALVRAGAVVEAEGVYFARQAYDDAVQRIVATLRERAVEATPGLTVAQVRDLLGSSRKHVLPLLNRLDREGITCRRGDLRELGPRAPSTD